MFKFLQGSKKKSQHITVLNEPYQYDKQYPLLSIHLGSNRVDKLTEFVEALELVTVNTNAYEVNVKIDSEDNEMIQCVEYLIAKFGANKIKPLIAPRKEGLWSLWEYYNELFHQAHPKCYFFWNPSDEVRITTHGWDQILEKYIGFFPDHIFRLKLSDNRLRNYYNIREILGTPDNFPFITKKWMDICGVWNDCHSPDLFHQGISYYLGKMDMFRDIPIFDIELSGIEAGCLLTPKQVRERSIGCERVWGIAMSKRIRKRYYAHAAKLLFYVQSCKKAAKKIEYDDYINAGFVECKNDLPESRRFSYASDIFIIKDNISFKEKLVQLVVKRIRFVERFVLRSLRFILRNTKKGLQLLYKVLFTSPLVGIMLIATSGYLWLAESTVLLRGITLILLFLSIANLNHRSFDKKESHMELHNEDQ